MAKKMEAESERDVHGDSSHLEDQVMKTAAQFFGDDLLPYMKVKGKILGIAPTEQVHLEVKRMEEDFNFLMEDGTWRHLEFESDRITEADLRRFREYDAYIGMVYNVPVITTVLCSARTKILKRELVNGESRYRVEVIRMKDQDADQLFHDLEKRLARGEMLSRKRIFPLLLTPLMSGKTKISERICRALDIIQSNLAKLKKEERRKMEAVLYALAIKFLEKEELKQVKERIRMTLLGQMLRDDGIAEGLKKGMEKGMEKGEWLKLIAIVGKKYRKGQASSEIAADLMEEEGMIDRIVAILSSNPQASGDEVYSLLQEGK